MIRNRNKKIKGRVANKGIAKGPAKIVNSFDDFERFERGDVLVAKITDPSYVIIISKAAAIITDLGGVTSHPAIIAREFDIPCIVGTEVGTKEIREGDILLVDADKGLISIIG